MSAQEGRLRPNFIAVLGDQAEQQRALESVENPVRSVSDYLLGLMAAVLARRGRPR
jgi:hypothetical protein